MKWIVGAVLLFVAALALQMHFIAWAVVLVFGLWQTARHVVRGWLAGIAATREVSQLEARTGDVVQVTLRFACRGRWPLLWALCEELTPDLPAGREGQSLKINGKTAGVLQGHEGPEQTWQYLLKCQRRGYYQLGPLVLETGDVFGMERRFRVLVPPVWLLVRPEIIPLEGYSIESRRPIGSIVMTHRLFEDPTRTIGVRQYQPGDPLNRIHWRATARAGSLQSRIFEPTSQEGAALVIDFHRGSYDPVHEPVRSELAILAAASIVNLLFEMNQQVGLMSNGRDAVDRIQTEGWRGDARTRDEARASAQMRTQSERLQPVLIPPSKSAERLELILDQLARLELTDGLKLNEALAASQGRLPRDATVIVILSRIDEAAAFAFGNLKRQGFAVTAIVNGHDEEDYLAASSYLVAEGIAATWLRDRDSIPGLCRDLASHRAFAR